LNFTKSITTVLGFIALSFPAPVAADVYSGEPYAEALFDLVQSSSLLISHELSSGSALVRTDVFRLTDGRLLAVTSRADKSGDVFSVEKLRITSRKGEKLTKKLPALDSVDLPKQDPEQAPRHN
jgi:hypothetical protein